jgi:hypothetical protein
MQCLTRAKEPLAYAQHWPANPDAAKPSSAVTQAVMAIIGEKEFVMFLQGQERERLCIQ